MCIIQIYYNSNLCFVKEETINLRKDNLRKIKLQDTTQLEITHSNAIIINHYHHHHHHPG